jgi:hypothetical protein
MAGLDTQDAQDRAIEALGGREVRDGDADVVEDPARLPAATDEIGLSLNRALMAAGLVDRVQAPDARQQHPRAHLP